MEIRQPTEQTEDVVPSSQNAAMQLPPATNVRPGTARSTSLHHASPPFGLSFGFGVEDDPNLVGRLATASPLLAGGDVERPPTSRGLTGERPGTSRGVGDRPGTYRGFGEARPTTSSGFDARPGTSQEVGSERPTSFGFVSSHTVPINERAEEDNYSNVFAFAPPPLEEATIRISASDAIRILPSTLQEAVSSSDATPGPGVSARAPRPEAAVLSATKSIEVTSQTSEPPLNGQAQKPPSRRQRRPASRPVGTPISPDSIQLNAQGRSSEEDRMFYQEEAELYASDEDENVFAFMPPGLGPSVELDESYEVRSSTASERKKPLGTVLVKDAINLGATGSGKDNGSMADYFKIQASQLHPAELLAAAQAQRRNSNFAAYERGLTLLGRQAHADHAFQVAFEAAQYEMAVQVAHTNAVNSSGPTSMTLGKQRENIGNPLEPLPGLRGGARRRKRPALADVIQDPQPIPEPNSTRRHAVDMDSQGPVEGDEQEDSDYIEVRCSVSHLDDYDEHALTLRVLIIALFLITVSVGANAYWTFRYPSPTITTAVAVLAAWPVGRTLAHWTPKWTFHFPKLFGGHAVQLNPGYWSMKEHSLIAQMVMVSLNTQATYPMFSLSALDLPVFWNLRTPYSFAILFTFSSILFGAGLAGLGRRFLVKPASMIWPQNLQISLMINVLHAEPEPERGRMNRLKFFWIVFGVIFVWQIVPSFLFTALSTFNWICWIAPNNVAVNHIFGFTNGMALFPVTLDYTQLNYFASPTLAPWWAGANLGVGYLIMWVFIGTILYFKNALNFGYLPFNGPSSSDKFGHRYNAPRVLKGQDFDPEAYENYSPLYLTVASYLDFWSSLALAGALLVHTYLNFQNFIWMNLRTGTAEIDDVHARQMRRYKDVPDYLYGVMIVISFGFVVAAVKIYDLGLPVWGIIIGYALVGVYFLPVTILLAQTALVTTVVNVIGEFIIGYALPGRAIPNMIFKAFVVGSTLSGQTFSQALKMGHYMKIGPRFSLACQLSAMLWADVVLLAVKELMTARIPDLCSHNQASLLTCPGQRFYYSSSIVWGVIGPRRLFSSTANRISLSYALAAGALLPIPFWYLNRRYPRRIWKFVNVPLMLFGVPFAMAGDPVNTTAFVAINFIAQYIIRRRYFPIWDRYNYLAGAACDAAAATCGLLLFVSVQIPNVTLNWIGNIIWQNTRDQEGRGWIPIPPSGIPFPS